MTHIKHILRSFGLYNGPPQIIQQGPIANRPLNSKPGQNLPINFSIFSQTTNKTYKLANDYFTGAIDVPTKCGTAETSLFVL